MTVGPHDDNLAARLRVAEEQLADARLRLTEAEQTGAEVGELREALRTAAGDLAALEQRRVEETDELRRALERSEARADHLERVRADLQGSLSWKLTKPLRAAKRGATGGGPQAR